MPLFYPFFIYTVAREDVDRSIVTHKIYRKLYWSHTYFSIKKKKNQRKKMKIKLFQLIQATYAILGITSHQSVQKYPFNWKILMVSFSYGSSSIIQLIYLTEAIQSANRISECTDSIFITATTISVALYFAISVYYMSELFRFIRGCEKMVDTGE